MSKKNIKDENGKTYTVKEKKTFYKKWWFWLIVAIIAIAAFGGSESDSSSSDSSAKTEQKSSDTKSSESKKESSNEKTINDEIAKSLSEDQNYAQQGNSDFEFSNYINSIKYTGDKQITVYVNEDFINLPEDTKTNYLNQVQGIVQMPLLDHNKITNDDCREGLFITINLGSNSIGTSKITEHREYKFNN